MEGPATPTGEKPSPKKNDTTLGKWKRELRLFFNEEAMDTDNAMFTKVGAVQGREDPTMREDIYILLDEKHVLKLPQLVHFQRTLPKAKNGANRCVLELEVQIGKGYNGICDWANYHITSKCQWKGNVQDDYHQVLMRLKKYVLKTIDCNQEVQDAKFLFEALGEGGMSRKTILVQKNTLRVECPGETARGVKLPGAAEVTRGGVWSYYDAGNGSYHSNKTRVIQQPTEKDPPRPAKVYLCHRSHVISQVKRSLENRGGDVVIIGQRICGAATDARRTVYPDITKDVITGELETDYIVVPGDFPLENISDRCRVIVQDQEVYEEVDSREALKEKGAVHVMTSKKQLENAGQVIGDHWRLTQPPDYTCADPETCLGVPFQCVKIEGDQIYYLLNRLPISAQHLLAEADLVGGYPTYLNRSLKWILEL